MAAPPVPRAIAKLPEAVVNRIAAGEASSSLSDPPTPSSSPADLISTVSQIIQRPANALKELIENSLDAGSTSIRVSVKDGGIKLLQIQDNGSGIRKEDLPILCERFTTSKIKEFDDLSSLGTYGFRGEALASISHVAHLTITTKTKADACAWKAAFSDGAMVPVKSDSSVASAVPTAGNDGTTIVVEDLFFNTPQRLKSLRSASDEYSRIVAVVIAYSIHNAGVAMSCKRPSAGQTADVNTQVGGTVLDNIGLSYGDALKKELVRVEAERESLGVKMEAYCSGPNYQAKRGIFLFFINNRFVDCSPLKRALEGFYGTLLAKGTHAFVYLALSIDPRRIDVNVHPTKKEVGFEDEDEIVELVCESLAKALEEQGESRSYRVQTLLPSSDAARPSSSSSKRASASVSSLSDGGDLLSSSSTRATDKHPNPTTRKITKTAPQKLVRTDATSQTLDSMFPIVSAPCASSGQRRDPEGRAQKRRGSAEVEGNGEDASDIDEIEIVERSKKRVKSDHANPTFAKTVADEQARQMKLARVRIGQSECALTSVKSLRSKVIEDRNEELDRLFKNHIFVGIADLQTGRSLVQHQTKLYLVKHNVVAEQLFYQLTLRQFGRFNRIKLKPPPSLEKLVRLGVEKEYPRDGTVKLSIEEIATKIHRRLMDVREMIDEYFSIEIDDKGHLVSLPVILPGHAPNLEKLPLFLLRIGIYVDWERELECFDSLATELAYFYAPNRFLARPLSSRSPQQQEDAGSERHENEIKANESNATNLIKNVLFPAFKQYLVPSDQLVTGVRHRRGQHARGGDGNKDNGERNGDDRRDADDQGQVGERDAIVLVTRLESLYKVFERC